MSRVSIIIPCYNAERFVVETTESVLRQTFTDWEIVFVDDGSTDRTVAIIKGYAERYPQKIKYLQQKNSGSATARNTGIKNSTGELIAFLDADDVWAPDKLEKQIAFMRSSPDTDLTYTNAMVISETGKDLWAYVKTYEFGYRPEEMYVRLLLRNFIPLSSIVVKRAILDEVGSFDASVWSSEDSDLLLRVSKKFRIQYFNETLVKYRVSATNKSQNLELRHRAGIRNRMVHYDKSLVKPFYFRFLLRRRQARSYYDLGYVLFEKNRFLEARKELLSSLKLWPFLLFGQYFYFMSTFIPLSALEGLRSFKRTNVGQLKSHAKS